MEELRSRLEPLCRGTDSPAAAIAKWALQGTDADWEVLGLESSFIKNFALEHLEQDNQDDLVSMDTLTNLVLVLVDALNVKSLMKSSWTRQDGLHATWQKAIKTPELEIPTLAVLIELFVRNISPYALVSVWEQNAEKWFARCKNASSKLDITSLIHSLELCIARSYFGAPVAWENYRLEWLAALKRIQNEDLKEVREVIRLAYDMPGDEEGHATAGHRCISEKDKAIAAQDGSALLFGEFAVSGVHRAFDTEHLDGSSAETVYDFGMGLGKLLLQVYVTFPNIKKLVGVELSPSRYDLGADALRRLVSYNTEEYKIQKDSEKIVSIQDGNERLLEFREQNLFDCREGLDEADIIILETHFPKSIWIRMSTYILGMKRGARLLTYENLREVYSSYPEMPFEQIPLNVVPDDRFFTTWSVRRGHHFYCWVRK